MFSPPVAPVACANSARSTMIALSSSPPVSCSTPLTTTCLLPKFSKVPGSAFSLFRAFKPRSTWSGLFGRAPSMRHHGLTLALAAMSVPIAKYSDPETSTARSATGITAASEALEGMASTWDTTFGSSSCVWAEPACATVMPPYSSESSGLWGTTVRLAP